MKLQTVLLGRAIRRFDVFGAGGGTIYGAHLARSCEERYGFLQGPRTLGDFDQTKGIGFLHGYFEGRVIDRFEVFANGLVAEAKHDTDLSDAFIDDVIQWAEKLGVLEFRKQPSPQRYYVSNMEIQSDISLAQSFPMFNNLGIEIDNKLREYGQFTAEQRIVSFSLGTPGTPMTFTFEYRANAPSVYFATAPLRTADHLRALEILEHDLARTSEF